MADKQKKTAGRTVASKALTIQEYKRRLRDSIKSLNDNFVHILESAKITSDEAALKSTSGRMTEYYTVKNEMVTRAALMVRAADDLTKLNNDLKEFLILCDFNFLSCAIENAEEKCELKTQEGTQKWNNIRVEVNKMISDIEFLMSNS
uniref:Mediator of RNA polymerase II transcription subunit 22 n=1 Tax=Steinernema glaseri TaxID=37863 RepID=A0A1I8AI18_9BILA